MAHDAITKSTATNMNLQSLKMEILQSYARKSLIDPVQTQV